MRRGTASRSDERASDVLVHTDGAGYGSLFATTFDLARNPMALIDEERRFVGLNPAAHAAGEQRLSGREREVVQMLADGKTGAEIAEELYLSPLTVQTHVRNAMRKFGALTRVHLVALVLRRGLL